MCLTAYNICGIICLYNFNTLLIYGWDPADSMVAAINIPSEDLLELLLIFLISSG